MLQWDEMVMSAKYLRGLAFSCIRRRQHYCNYSVKLICFDWCWFEKIWEDAMHLRFWAWQKPEIGLSVLSREMDFMRPFLVAFLTNGVLNVIHGAINLTTLVLIIEVIAPCLNLLCWNVTGASFEGGMKWLLSNVQLQAADVLRYYDDTLWSQKWKFAHLANEVCSFFTILAVYL